MVRVAQFPNLIIYIVTLLRKYQLGEKYSLSNDQVLCAKFLSACASL